MDLKELIKYQLFSQMGAAGATGGPRSGPLAGVEASAGPMVAMLLQFLLFALMSVAEDIMKAIPGLCVKVKERVVGSCTQYVANAIPEQRAPMLADTSIGLHARHTVAKFVMMRVYATDDKSAAETTSEETNGMVDAVVAFVSKLQNVPVFSLIDKGNVMVAFKDKPFQITRDIFFKLDTVTYTNGGNVASIKVTLLSNTISAAEIAAFVKGLYHDYLEERKNSLGDNIYFFDQKTRDGAAPPMLPTGTPGSDAANAKAMMIRTAPKHLSFCMTPFFSNKQFANIFGAEVRHIEDRVRFFLERRDWYDAKGVPYQLGLLLSGIPGAGKTSVIRAIANLTKRHIVNINFANISTATQLKNIFYSDRLHVYTDHTISNTQSFFIPIHQRIYVLEEIDAIGDVVKQRSPDNPQGATVPDELTLAEILTVLDGTIEAPGRIIIMTSNHPETLDAALIRPGRIDVQVRFDYAKRELLAEMYAAYFDRPLPAELVDRLPDRRLTPAEVGQVLFRHFGSNADAEAIVADLCARAEEAAWTVAEAPTVKPVAKDDDTPVPKEDDTPVAKDDEKTFDVFDTQKSQEQLMLDREYFKKHGKSKYERSKYDDDGPAFMVAGDDSTYASFEPLIAAC